MKFIIGKKIGMTQVFNKEGKAVPVTVIEAGPCFITQIKNKEHNGYESIQIGFEKLKDKKIKKTQKGKEFRFLKEFPAQGLPAGKAGGSDSVGYNVGDKIVVDIFSEGDKIRVSGTSKGRGFQGVVKRHGFKGGPRSHGAKHTARKPGSIGSSFPERVLKGKKMAGHMGVERVSVKNLKIVVVDKENNLLAVSGAVPGPNGGLVEIMSI